MLEQIRRSLRCRVSVALAALPLTGCADPAVAPPGYFEIVGVLGRGAACDAAGELRLQALDVPSTLLVSGGELCSGAPQRRELPPGLYLLSWQSAAQQDTPVREPSLLRGPAVVSLLPGQLTRLRVQVEALPAAAVSAATASSGFVPDAVETHAEPSSICGQGLRRPGAS